MSTRGFLAQRAAEQRMEPTRGNWDCARLIRNAGPTGVLRGDQAQVRHELAGMREPSDVADLRDETYRRDKRDPAQRLQGLDDRGPPPRGRELPELVGQALDAAFGL